VLGEETLAVTKVACGYTFAQVRRGNRRSQRSFGVSKFLAGLLMRENAAVAPSPTNFSVRASTPSLLNPGGDQRLGFAQAEQARRPALDPGSSESLAGNKRRMLYRAPLSLPLARSDPETAHRFSLSPPSSVHGAYRRRALALSARGGMPMRADGAGKVDLACAGLDKNEEHRRLAERGRREGGAGGAIVPAYPIGPGAGAQRGAPGRACFCLREAEALINRLRDSTTTAWRP